MRISYITAGAGGMYCGSCLRDNTLAARLMADGHEVHLIPLYTPTRTDEDNVSDGRVFLGGINVYLQQKFPIFRRTPAFLDRLLDAGPLIRLATRWGVSIEPAYLGALTVSMLRGTEGFQSKEIEKLARFIGEELEPDLISLPNSLLLGLAPLLRARAAVPVCCTLQGEDLFLEGLAEPYRTESLRLIRAASDSVDLFIAVSEFCAARMSDYLGIPSRKIRVVPLGINLDGHGPRPGGADRPFTIGYLARIAPEKGLHILAEAYRAVRQEPGLPPSRLVAAGYIAPEHRGYLEEVEGRIAGWGLAGDFRYHGCLERQEKIDFLRGLDLLSVPSPYDEPKGMYLLEAMANGIPVVQPRKAAFTEIIERTGGGILVDPEDAGALGRGILELWRDPARRAELGRRGSEGVRAHYSSQHMARRALEIYGEILPAGTKETAAAP